MTSPPFTTTKLFRVLMTTSIRFSPRMLNLTVNGFTLLHIGLAKVEGIILYVDNI